MLSKTKIFFNFDIPDLFTLKIKTLFAETNQLTIFANMATIITLIYY